MDDIIDLIPKASRELSPQAYLDLTARERKDISSLRFELPKLGAAGFGRFVAKLKTPTYTVANGEKK